MPARLRIGVNALYLIPGGVGGTEIYLRNLLRSLAEIDSHNEYVVFTCRDAAAEACPAAGNFETHVAPVRARNRPARLVWEQTGLAAATCRRKLDVIFSPGFSSPALGRGKQVTVIHDLQHKRQPRNFGFVERLAWNWMVKGSVRRADAIIAVSEATRRDIAEFFPKAANRIRVIHHGVEPVFFGLRENPDFGRALLAQAGVPDSPYVLAVSTVHPHKNWMRLLEAYEQMRWLGRREHLVVAGLPGKAWKRVWRQVENRALGGYVHLLGWQPREVLFGLYKYASALVFPSTFEGFGMPVLEALAAGVPVACSDIPPLREIADGAAAFFNPFSPRAIAKALERVLAEGPARRRTIAYGVERASQFTWRRTAEETLAVLLETARSE